MTDWSRIYDWQMVFVGGVGVALTIFLVNPGDHTIDVGAFQLDMFYALLVAFVAVTISSVIGLRKSLTASGRSSALIPPRTHQPIPPPRR